MRIVLTALLLTVSASGIPEVRYPRSPLGYHERIGVPTARRIKEAEEKILDRSMDERIVGGSVAPDNAHPYLAGLIITLANTDFESSCGSSLVTVNRLVTAAHCWNDGFRQAIQYIVVLGSRFLFSGGTRIVTSHVVMHPQWSPDTIRNDIAVIYLPRNVQLSASIQPIQLPGNFLSQTFAGEWSVAAGFGFTSDEQDQILPDAVLHHVDLRVISVAECQAYFGIWATPDNICTSGVGGVGICFGDSGGPLTVTRNRQRILVGVSSFVGEDGLCEAGHPSAYARVTNFYNFIMQHM